MAKLREAAATAPQPITEEDALAAMQLLAETQAQLDKVNSQKKLAQLDLDKKYEGKLKELSDAAAMQEKLILKYLEENRDAVLGTQKSKKFGLGTVGVRIGKAKLVLAAEGVTWEDVIKLAKKTMPEYVREEWQLQKDKLLSDFGKQPEANDQLLNIGVAIAQDETFFVKVG